VTIDTCADRRIEVADELQPALRQYRRLWLSLDDLAEAKAAAEQLLDARIPIPKTERPGVVLMSLTTAIVIAYSRPFVHVRGESAEADRTVPGALLRGLTAAQRELHNDIVAMRNREVAHSDAELVELELRLLADGHIAIGRNTRRPFNRGTLRSIVRLVSKVESAIDQRCEELRQVLPHHVWI
jgi:hypothetical protein